MPRIRSTLAMTRKPPPEGFDVIEPILYEFETKMKEVESKSEEGKRKVEAGWGVLQVHHQRTRYLYDLYYGKMKEQAKKKKLAARKKDRPAPEDEDGDEDEEFVMSRELWDYCCNTLKVVDVGLAAKWRKSGFESLCCLQCIQPGGFNSGSTCVCRVPRSKVVLEDIDGSGRKRVVQCRNCGCRGCSGG